MGVGGWPCLAAYGYVLVYTLRTSLHRVPCTLKGFSLYWSEVCEDNYSSVLIRSSHYRNVRIKCIGEDLTSHDL